MGGRQARRVLAALGLGLTGLDAVAGALYAGDPAAFVAARDAAAKQARAAGDRELAASIKATGISQLGGAYCLRSDSEVFPGP